MIFGILRFAHFAHGVLMTIGGYGVLTAVWFIPGPSAAADFAVWPLPMGDRTTAP